MDRARRIEQERQWLRSWQQLLFGIVGTAAIPPLLIIPFTNGDYIWIWIVVVTGFALIPLTNMNVKKYQIRKSHTSDTSLHRLYRKQLISDGFAIISIFLLINGDQLWNNEFIHWGTSALTGVAIYWILRLDHQLRKKDLHMPTPDELK